MPVGFAVKELIDEVVVFDGGVVARFSTSRPPVTLVVPAFWMLVTTASARFGSMAIAVGGPLVGISCMGGVHVPLAVLAQLDVASNNGVKSMEETLFPPVFAISARARS